jgi:hypothetical protein
MNDAGYRLLVAAPDEDTIELHVLARAYRDAWRALYNQKPAGIHRLEQLGLAIEFEGYIYAG